MACYKAVNLGVLSFLECSHSHQTSIFFFSRGYAIGMRKGPEIINDKDLPV
jgi:hypothetical protein